MILATDGRHQIADDGRHIQKSKDVLNRNRENRAGKTGLSKDYRRKKV